MNENRALVVRPQLTPAVWDLILKVAPAMHKARFYNVASEEQAAAIMLTGYELGLGLAASFEFIKVILGKPGVIPRGALALIHQSPLIVDIKIDEERDTQDNPFACTVWMKRTNGFEYQVRFTMKDAERAGLVKPESGWEKWPANLLKWRAVGFCADVVAPDVLAGLKRADELGASISPEGDILEGQWEVVTPEAKVSPPVQPATPSEPIAPSEIVSPEPETEQAEVHLSLNDLVEKFGAEAILVANEGRIPGTQDELDVVAEKLKAEGDD